jgi:predicted ATPase
MLKRLVLTDFLSYGPGPQTIELAPLNVLIGPNGSGKSNLVEALAVLRAVPRDLPLPVRQGGGVEEWIWRGDAKGPTAIAAELEALFDWQLFRSGHPKIDVRFRLRFGSEGGAFVVLDERIENEHGTPKPSIFFGYQNGRPMLNTRGGEQRQLERADIDRTQSILSQRRDPDAYPELATLTDVLREMRIYRSWSFGPDAPLRSSCRADVPGHTLLEDFSNLPARLAVLKRDPATKRRLLELLGDLAPGFHDLEIVPEGGRLQLYLTDGTRNVPAHRLSDGTLRYLALLTILLDPGPAKLVVIEEPELGLHPDVFPTLRDLMVERSAHTQLVVTTHSTQLVDTLDDHAESVLICERDGATTTLQRLRQDDIARWRTFGSLGTLWMSGKLGGTRR